jgi:hypothetical protein
MKKSGIVFLKLLLLLCIILQLTGLAQANTSGKITSHGASVFDYSISGGNITKIIEADSRR